MAVWPVFVSEWQHACCGERFVLGDEVCWKLAVLGADRAVGLRDELAAFAGHVARVGLTEQGDPTSVVELDGGVVGADWGCEQRVGAPRRSARGPCPGTSRRCAR